MNHDTPRQNLVSDTSRWLTHAMTLRRGTGGRPSKGERDLLVTRPAVPVGQAIRTRADACGLTISEYVASVLAEHVGLPDLAPAAKPKRDQELPMTG